MTDTDLQFEDATPVKRPFSGGSVAAPNPFLNVVAAIAGQKNEDGSPAAKAYTYTSESEDKLTTDRNRVERQLTAAGNALDTPVTVRKVHEDKHTEEQIKPGQPKVKVYRTRTVFWTVPKYAPKPAVTADTAHDTAE